MAKLILQFEGVTLKECAVGSQPVDIGRLPDNAVMIDNAAVSNRHARVLREGDHYVIEDLQSTNGTFVNEKPATRQRLQHGDVVLVGKHKLIFEESDAEGTATTPASPAKALPDLEGTFVLQTRQHKKMLEDLGIEPPIKPPPSVSKAAERIASQATPPAQPIGNAEATQFIPTTAPITRPPTTTIRTERAAPTLKTASLHVLSGRTDQSTYELSAHTSIVGKSHEALVKLKGWFKPKVAIAIARKGDGYAVTPLGGQTQINGKPLDDRRDLKDGDVLQVSGLTLEFRMK